MAGLVGFSEAWAGKPLFSVLAGMLSAPNQDSSEKLGIIR